MFLFEFRGEREEEEEEEEEERLSFCFLVSCLRRQCKQQFPPPPSSLSLFPLECRLFFSAIRQVLRAMDPPQLFLSRDAVGAARKGLQRHQAGSTHSRATRENRLPPRCLLRSPFPFAVALAFRSVFSPYRARVARRPLPQGRRSKVRDPRSADGARRGGHSSGSGCRCGRSLERRVVRLRAAQRQHFPMRRRSSSLEHPARAAMPLLLVPVCRHGVDDGVLLVLHVFSLNQLLSGERRILLCFFSLCSCSLSLLPQLEKLCSGTTTFQRKKQWFHTQKLFFIFSFFSSIRCFFIHETLSFFARQRAK